MTRLGGTWRNWAHTERVRPQRVERPRSVAAVQRAVRAAADRGLRVKAVGAGHSFTGVAVAPGVLLELDDLTGLSHVDPAAGTATLLAGTRLHRVPALLAAHSLAMTNLGDIDRQSVAGAISTGTHGTGIGFGGLASQVVGASVVTADGELRRFTAADDELAAVALGLGALGILVEVTLQCVPAFLLHAVERPEPIDGVLDGLVARAAESDHLEFYWFPHTAVALTKTNTRLPGDAARRPLHPLSRFLDDEALANGFYRLSCATGAVLPAVVPPVNRLAARLTGNREYTDRSHRVFTQHRGVRFREMEYALPADAVVPAMGELRRLIDRRGWRLSFPVEVRFAAGDDRWLSTAHGRVSGYIAVHRYWRERQGDYFREVERIMLDHDGRPHWGKLHGLDHERLERRYPRFGDFLALRDRLDPQRMFTNRHLDRVLGP